MKFSVVDLCIMLNCVVVSGIIAIVLPDMGVSIGMTMCIVFLNFIAIYGVQTFIVLFALQKRKDRLETSDSRNTPEFPNMSDDGRVKMDPIVSTLFYVFAMLASVLIGAFFANMFVGAAAIVVLFTVFTVLANLKFDVNKVREAVDE